MGSELEQAQDSQRLSVVYDGYGHWLAPVVCWWIGHRYRNRVPRVFHCEVYCQRCRRVFGSFDAPQARTVWEQDASFRRRTRVKDVYVGPASDEDFWRNAKVGDRI